MNSYTVNIQGRQFDIDIAIIQSLLKGNPTWGRTRLSEELCRLWNWRTDTGRLKDMACRTLLLKLDRAKIIQLPPRKRPANNKIRNRNLPDIFHETTPIHGPLQKLTPVNVVHVLQTSPELDLFKCLLSRYHYIGLQNTVGENIKYLVMDNRNRPLACLLFGSAAWKCACRDDFIGWDRQVRQSNLSYLTNNTRFLILPWVQVPHLASHVLARVTKRISTDWQSKYGHPIFMLETFVDRSLYRGTCYQAANWILVGQTKGRTRNDRYNTIKTSVKDIYLYPLIKQYALSLQNK